MSFTFDNAREKISRLNEHAIQLFEQGNHDQAINTAAHACDLARQYLGENDPDYTTILDNLTSLLTIFAELQKRLGHYAVAEGLNKKALEIHKEALGDGDPSYAILLNNLASVYWEMDNYIMAEPFYHQACDILRAARGENSPEYATALNNLGNLYRSMGDLAEAENYHKRALEKRRSFATDNDVAVAESANNLAAVYRAMGDFAAADPLYHQACDIFRATRGENSPEYATALNNLGNMYQSMGDYTEAERLLQQALKSSLEAQDSPKNIAHRLNNLGFLYRERGNFAAAESYFLRALELIREKFANRVPEYAQDLHNLGILYVHMRRYEEARQIFEERLQDLLETHSEHNPEYAGTLNDLAAVYHYMGDYAAAEPLYLEALETRRKVLGEKHPEVAESLINLATLYVAMDRKGEAIALTKQAAAIPNQRITQVFSVASERQRLAYFEAFRGTDFAILLSLFLEHLSQCSTAAQEALDLVLRRKALAAEASIVQRAAVLSERYPDLKPLFREWVALGVQVAEKTIKGPGPEGLEAHWQELEEWNARKERLERHLSQHVLETNLEQYLESVNRYAVANALPKGTVLIEFVRLRAFDFKAVGAKDQLEWKPPCYMAFVLPSEEPDNIQVIPLGEVEPVDQMIAALHDSISSRPSLKKVLARPKDWLLKQVSIGRHRTKDERTAAELRTIVFDPLLHAVGDCKRLLLSPDGDLTRLPFEVLPTTDKQRLIDKYYISYVSVGRDVLRFSDIANGRYAEPLVVACPDFELSSGGAGTESEEPEIPRGKQSRDLDRDTLYFDSLPGTQIEGERIADMLGVVPLLGRTALEGSVKKCQSPTILHIATHGFFLSDQTGNLPAGGLGRLTELGLENPLLRSGLALAGANIGLRGGLLPKEAQDGILTAEEVSGLDLLNTDLVVLSACDTGLGRVQIGEGVLGLRRSFMVGGAKTLVMSLWKVPDKETQELMVDFYRHMLEGQSCSNALRRAQLAMKARNPDPLYWGAFICQGYPDLSILHSMGA